MERQSKDFGDSKYVPEQQLLAATALACRRMPHQLID